MKYLVKWWSHVFGKFVLVVYTFKLWYIQFLPGWSGEKWSVRTMHVDLLKRPIDQFRKVDNRRYELTVLIYILWSQVSQSQFWKRQNLLCNIQVIATFAKWALSFQKFKENPGENTLSLTLTEMSWVLWSPGTKMIFQFTKHAWTMLMVSA